MTTRATLAILAAGLGLAAYGLAALMAWAFPGAPSGPLAALVVGAAMVGGVAAGFVLAAGIRNCGRLLWYGILRAEQEGRKRED